MKPSEMVAEWKRDGLAHEPSDDESETWTVKVDDDIWALFSEGEDYVCVNLFEKRATT